LIALVILGVIATFTIPKVLQSQSDTKFKSIGKEVAGMIAETHQNLRLQGNLNANTTRENFTPYFNYVRVVSVGSIDLQQTVSTRDCSLDMCLLLHNGGVIAFADDSESFGNTASTNALVFSLDPDGKVTDGTTNGPGKAVNFFIYYDGKIRTKGTMEPNTYNSGGSSNPDPTKDPPWFSWN